ncbi:Protein FAM32A [Geodia barretti]|uniref:Protein FAM32A n=1 Tax=Geodia barretti TaxID=519541 RepID=A0AA35RJW0_GEOBA|nr:Protein FAM32A [Geodia barretti]
MRTYTVSVYGVRERDELAAMSDAYAECVGGSLKLKGVSSGGVKKKKKKKSKAEEVVEVVEKVEEKAEEVKNTRTSAEKAYAAVQAKRQKQKVLEKAKKTHKQRVEEMNKYLDTLTEHFDIPKVSWTK